MDSPLVNYKRMGNQYGLSNDEKPIHRYYSKPNLLSLYPDANMEGKDFKRILDLGCGTGYFGFEAALRYTTAEVDLLDGSEALLEMAKARAQAKGLLARSKFIAHDLSLKMDFFEDQRFDFIVSGLAIHYVLDWKALFGEISRILKPGGTFIFSTHNPYLELSYFKLENYFQEQLIEDNWGDMGKVTFYHHSFESLVKASLSSGLTIVDMVEAYPSKELEAIDSKWYEILSTTPHFLFIKMKAINPLFEWRG